MQKTLIIVLVSVLIIVSFVLQNASPVKLTLWFWKIDTSLSMLIFFSVALGALLSYLASLPNTFKKNKQLADIKEKLKSCQKEEKFTERSANTIIEEEKKD